MISTSILEFHSTIEIPIITRKLYIFYPTLQLNLPLSLSPKTSNSIPCSIPHLNYSGGHNQKSWLLLLFKTLLLASEALQL